MDYFDFLQYCVETADEIRALRKTTPPTVADTAGVPAKSGVVVSEGIAPGMPPILMAATGKGNRQVYPLEVVGETAPIEWADEPAAVIIENKEPTTGERHIADRNDDAVDKAAQKIVAGFGEQLERFFEPKADGRPANRTETNEEWIGADDAIALFGGKTKKSTFYNRVGNGLITKKETVTGAYYLKSSVLECKRTNP